MCDVCEGWEHACLGERGLCVMYVEGGSMLVWVSRGCVCGVCVESGCMLGCLGRGPEYSVCVAGGRVLEGADVPSLLSYLWKNFLMQ